MGFPFVPPVCKVKGLCLCSGVQLSLQGKIKIIGQTFFFLNVKDNKTKDTHHSSVHPMYEKCVICYLWSM